MNLYIGFRSPRLLVESVVRFTLLSLYIKFSSLNALMLHEALLCTPSSVSISGIPVSCQPNTLEYLFFENFFCRKYAIFLSIFDILI
ncbi:hypothetical protein BpHYR1_001558, partial [Brachionus plicatilis]